MDDSICPLCGKQCQKETDVSGDIANIKYKIKCHICGKYNITVVAAHHVDPAIDAKKWILSALTRENTELGNKPIEINRDNTEKLLNSKDIPSPLEKMDKILLYIYKSTSAPGKWKEITSKVDYPVAYATDESEMKFYLDNLLQRNLIELASPQMPDVFRLTIQGWERIDELRRKSPEGNQCFVAMWFKDDFFDEVYPAIKNAIEKSGYNPKCLKIKIHNNKICDEIIAELRKSSLCVADITEHRAAVYFEAGFAFGLNIPVIYTCKDGTTLDNIDTNQYPHITWKNTQDLETQLTEKILALYPLN